MNRRVLLRAASGPAIGMGHAMRTRAVAHEVRRLGGEPILILDDIETASRLATEGFETRIASKRPDWTQAEASAAWFDGFWDWSPEIEEVRDQGTPCVLVENRSPARERAQLLVYPALHYRADEWDRRHASRILSGARWIPLAPDIVAADRSPAPDVELLVSFGGSDPLRSTERVLAQLSAHVGHVVVSVGLHMRERIPAIRRAASHLPGVRILPVGSRLAEWMVRSRRAITAVGTTLYEMAYLGVPAMILANFDADAEVFEHYREHGPHHPLGLAARLDDGQLRAAMAAELEHGSPSFEPIQGLGGGARALARRLLATDVTAEISV